MNKPVGKSRIVVIGSCNTDLVIKSKTLPGPGETILGGDLMMNAGGKGANQATAVCKLGGKVSFVARLGQDVFGEQAMKGFEKIGLDTSYITFDTDRPSGAALIMIDEGGENCISVALGANNALSKEDIDNAKPVLSQASHVLMQLESPMDTMVYAAASAKKLGATTVLDPAPAQALPESLLKNIDIITPNESEAEVLTGIKVTDKISAGKAAQELTRAGVSTVIVTLGEQGAYIHSDDLKKLIPTVTVNALDTTAAGDTFNGALAVGLAAGLSLQEAVSTANYAASITVTRVGAQQAIPTKEELETIYPSHLK